MKAFIISILFLAAFAGAAAGQSLEISDLEESNYFDFWLGEWELTWQQSDGSTGHGTNVIRRILGGQVIEENFTATDGSFAGYEGRSHSVYDARTDEWKQTWVDSQGGYLDFTGEVDGNRRIFRRNGVDPQGNPILQRMVFYDITRDSLMWDWERSTDNGESWQLQWRISYKRKN